MDAIFCVEALEEALALYGRPEIFNSDQGAQFTSTAFTSPFLIVLPEHAAQVQCRPSPSDSEDPL